MPKRIELKPHLTTAELYRRYRQCREPQEKARWRALHLISQGARAADAARRAGHTSGWVTQLTQCYNACGAEAVATKRGAVKPGPKPGLNAQAAIELDAALRVTAPDGGLWTAPEVARWIAERTGQSVHETTVWRAMRRLGFTLQVPRPRHRRSASAEEQAAFKKSSATRPPK
ncbi:MAG: winged helix-turn-helix domain-containing protein [Acidobacteria bacterium]|nr:winged helix-turn-helix domain-containing protein [Acidobacteriota bacterium]